MWEEVTGGLLWSASLWGSGMQRSPSPGAALGLDTQLFLAQPAKVHPPSSAVAWRCHRNHGHSRASLRIGRPGAEALHLPLQSQGNLEEIPDFLN